jgi:hypothetical protein
LSDALEDLVRSDISYESCNGKTDGCLGEDRTHALAGDSVGDVDQSYFVCGQGDSLGVFGTDRFGNSATARKDRMPLQISTADNSTVDSPAEIYCILIMGDAGLDTTTNAFYVNKSADANGAYPIFIDAAFQTNASGTDQYKNQFLADIYITHKGGAKGWPECTIEYDARLSNNSSGY